ncbi:MAG: beta galactosidase jelly roll domain-containing protein [Bacteroidetes bacterium]|nr:beta galactosidase jelly roll domain-containing protein [Bacteroidota bacterium]
MMRHIYSLFMIFTITLSSSVGMAMGTGRTIELKHNWVIQSSDKLDVGGETLSGESFIPDGWYKASVPSTVLGTLVADGVFTNVFQGRNLDKIPDSMFVKPWWYRTTFNMPAKAKNADHVTLKFLGINYKADIWLNGKLIASSDSVLGGFRQFQFDITNDVHFGGKNVLAVQIYKPGPGSLTLGFVDWSPEPQDRDMGLWRPVELHISGDVSMEYPFVATKVDTATLKKACLTVSTELTNKTDHEVTGTLEGEIAYFPKAGALPPKVWNLPGPPGGAIVIDKASKGKEGRRISFSQKVTLSPGETKIVAFSPETFKQLIIKDPHLWWTHDFGKPNLYSLHLQFKSNGLTTDYSDTKFGIRQINDYINPEGFRGYMLNGKKILIRGGGWADQIFLQQNEKNLRAQIDYAVNMHLNAIRMEGFWGENSDIFNLCDEKGILIMAGFSCQWEWKNLFGTENDDYGCIRSPEDMELAARSFADEIKWLRNHPSIFVWLYGSDLHPRPELEKMYQVDLAKYDTTRPFLSSAAEHTSALTGPSRVKMRGPYDYVPPVYWYADTAFGGAFGFNTETGPGPQVPRESSLRKMLSPDSLWPINGEWYYHCSRGRFRDLRRYNDAIDGRLGTPTSLADYQRKAQFTSYEAMRPMFEAFAANKFKSTGVIQWMYNSAWPKMWWQLFDYYLNPTGAFYGAEKACEPIHVEYNYADSGIVVVNSTLESSDGLTLKVRVLDFNMKNLYNYDKQIDIAANAAKQMITLPEINSPTTTYFLDLRLYKGNELVSVNFYALSTTPDQPQWSKSTWYVTETKYADLKELNDLPNVKLGVKENFVRKGDKYFVTAEIHNPTDHLAFMVYLSVKEGNTGETVLPIFWDDNYMSLLPGETRTLKGHFYVEDLHGKTPTLEVSGWNVK